MKFIVLQQGDSVIKIMPQRLTKVSNKTSETWIGNRALIDRFGRPLGGSKTGMITTICDVCQTIRCKIIVYEIVHKRQYIGNGFQMATRESAVWTLINMFNIWQKHAPGKERVSKVRWKWRTRMWQWQIRSIWPCKVFAHTFICRMSPVTSPDRTGLHCFVDPWFMFANCLSNHWFYVFGLVRWMGK